MVRPFLPDAEKLAAVRAELPATAAGIYLDTGTAGPLPRETTAAMAEIADMELAVGRAHPDLHAETVQRMAEARAGVAAILGADVDAVALTHATTDGINLAAWGLDWRRGDRVVTTNVEHAGGLGPLRALAERFGVELASVDVADGEDDERTVAAFERALAPATRLVLVSHVAWSTGAVLPIGRIAEIAHARGALVVVDGAQAAGAIRVNLTGSTPDAYAIPAHKWLLGPEGMGALWVNPSAADRLHPSVGGAYSFEADDPEALAGIGSPRRWPDARRFEASHYHRPSIVGFARSCSWLSMYVGLDWIHDRGSALGRRAANDLARVPGVRVLTPRHAMAGLVSFRIAGWPAERALDELGGRVFAIARAIPDLDALRISVGFFNTEAELDRFIEAVSELARHTPETLPPRRLLTILGAQA
ncbi:MAG TPA: aminotransferase class V-fold PLP-dependent enzyme [Candidatus Limnocylindrales bacterium]